MGKGFWDKLEKPFFVLAPMADVTDAAFRRVIAKYGKPPVMWTEFVSADGLFLADELGRQKLMHDLLFTEAERPIVAQFFTAKPEMMKKASALAMELGFDGVDINMGCPDRSIEKQGAGAALMKTSELAVELIQVAKESAPTLPVSIKTRIGYNKDEIDTWVPVLLSAEPAAITFHLRTRKEMSKVSAHWELAPRIVDLRDRAGADTVVLGNGDVLSLEGAEQKAKDTGVDGVMLGKAIFGNPWLFSGRKFDGKNLYDISYKSNQDKNIKIYHSRSISVEERLRVMVEHTKLFEELLGNVKSFAVMKKHYKAYVNDFSGAKELRIKLMETKNAKEVEEIVSTFLKKTVI